jgi:hypothetical protein
MNKTLLNRLVIALLPLLFQSISLQAQNVGINETGANPDASAMLDINTSNKGLLIPRLSKAQKSLIASPANGLLVYQTDDTVGFWYYEQTKWVPVMRSITAGKGLTGGLIQGKGTIDLKSTGVVARKYGAMDSIPVVTVNAEGQITVCGVQCDLKLIGFGHRVAGSISKKGPFNPTRTQRQGRVAGRARARGGLDAPELSAVPSVTDGAGFGNYHLPSCQRGR